MPSSFVSFYCHIVFSTKQRRSFMHDSWRLRLHAYIIGILRSLGVFTVEIGGPNDHVHILALLGPRQCIADLLCKLKSRSSGWIHDVIGYRPFEWQDGYGAFSVSKSDVPRVQNYIRNQQEHHKMRTFQEEFIELLKENGIEFDERYLF
jgi:putative transposase